MRVHVLTPGFTSPNGRAFLFPLLAWRSQLRDAGFDLHFCTTASSALADCDVLAIDSKFYGPRWAAHGDAVEAEIAALAGRVTKTLWFDISDSSGWDHARPLPYVSAWIKNQLLRDRSLYLRPIYGAGRIYADFAYRRGSAEDSQPEWSRPVVDPTQLDKLHVGWNSGLADYSLFGPARMALYSRLPLGNLLRFPSRWTAPDANRPREVSCRFGTSYARDSVAWQRCEIARQVARRMDTGKIGRRSYLAELAAARVVISPFGLGEITLKDFEAYRAGAALIKPDMGHLHTWPHLFRAGDTMFSHGWDLSDFIDRLDEALASPRRRLEIACAGQELYRRHTSGLQAASLFCERFAQLMQVGG